MRDYALTTKILRSCAENSCENCPIGGAEYTSKDCRKAHNDAADAIEELLTAVPKQGEWLPRPNPQFIEVDVCSVCGIGTRKMYHCTDGIQTWDEKPFFRYCPWCGAKLQEPPKGVE